jgi:septal ring-binding cell division protein DamX
MAKRKETVAPMDEQRWGRASEMLPFAALLTAVIGVLTLGALMRTPGPAPPPRPVSAPVAAVGGSLLSRPAPGRHTLPPRRKAPAARLAARVATDIERLADEADGWTAQIAVLCDAGRAAELIDRFGNHEALYILPSLHGDAACYRLCWNRYATRAAAKAAHDLPAGLRAVEPSPLPKSLAEVLE